jgi:glycerophosphoryl diester phosphodiesterase
MIIAHRTCPRDAPENSLAGIRAAALAGADAVEVDVRRSGDGVPMLLHDCRLLRTAGRLGRVDRMEADRLVRMRLRGGGTIPTFAAALAALGPTLRIAIDVKDGGAGDAVISEIRNQQLQDRSLFWSQHEEAVRRAVGSAPELEVALLRDTRTAEQTAAFLADAVRLRAHGISAHWSQVSPDLAGRCRERDLRLYAWCKTRSIDLGKLALLDGLVTDWPAIARSSIDPTLR